MTATAEVAVVMAVTTAGRWGAAVGVVVVVVEFVARIEYN